MTAASRIGFCGLGRMGFALVGQLARDGLEVAIWNRSRPRAEALGSMGVSICDSPAEVVERSDIVLTMVTDDDAVDHLFSSSQGLLSGNVEGKVFLEMSTIRPASAKRMGAIVKSRGGTFLSSPVIGSVYHAENRQLIALVGGDGKIAASVRPILERFCRKVIFVGDLDQSTALKLVVNLMTGTYLQCLSEALSLGSAHGLDLKMMLDTLTDGPTSCPLLIGKRPVLEGVNHDVGFPIAGMCKDMMTITATAAEMGVATPVAAATGASLAGASAGGFAERDIASLPAFARERTTKVWAK